MQPGKPPHARTARPYQLDRAGSAKAAVQKTSKSRSGQDALPIAPKLLLADEPTGNLDSKTSAEIMGLLEDVHQKGNTIILVTHEEDIAKHAHRIVRLIDGQIASDEPNNNIVHKKPAIA